MALTLSKTGIEQSSTINAWHVTQSVDALTGTAAYDITVSGSLDISNSTNTGDLVGTASWASNAVLATTATAATTATNANNAKVTNLVSNNINYRVTFISPTAAPAPSGTGYADLVIDSGSDGSGLYYNPSTNTLNASIYSGSNDGSQVDFVGTASHAISTGYFTDYVTASYNETTIYPQGTIFSKFENVFMSQSAVEEYDLLAATTTYTGDRTLPTNYVAANTSGEAKMVKFHIRGNVGDTGALGTPTLDSYVKIGTTTLNNGTKLGAINLEGANQVPFEIDYELTFTNNTVVAHGAVGYYDTNGNYKKVGLSDMYLPDSAPLTGGALQFITSGSSNIVLTGSSAYIEFIN